MCSLLCCACLPRMAGTEGQAAVDAQVPASDNQSECFFMREGMNKLWWCLGTRMRLRLKFLELG